MSPPPSLTDALPASTANARHAHMGDLPVEDAFAATLPSAQALPPTRIRLWDLPTRVFHWSLVVAVLTAVITGQVGGAWMRVHGIAGIGIVGLVVFRLVWGFVGSTHARFLNFVPTPKRLIAYLTGRWRGVGHNPLGALSVLALLGLLGVMAVTGLFSNDDIDFTGPLASWVSDSLSSRLTGLHRQLADALLVLIALHVLAIVFYAWYKKDNLVKPMVTGYKEVQVGEPARQGGWLAFLVALGAALMAVYVASGAALSHEAVVAAKPAAVSVAAQPSAAQPAATRPAW